MNKHIKKIIAVLLIVLTIAAYVFIPNREYFLSNKLTSKSVTVDDIVLKNFEQNSDGTYISSDDPQIILSETNAHVEYIVLDCEISGAVIEPKIYYTESRGQLFSEANCFSPQYEYRNGLLTLYIDKQIYSMRIDLTESSGFIMSLNNIWLSFLTFNFDPITAMMLVFLVILILIPMFLPKDYHERLNASLQSFKKYRHLLHNLIHKDIITKYRRSVLGIIWSILNPLLMMIVITAVFKEIFKIKIENFPLYYLTGSLIFNYVTEATTTSMNSILEASPLIRKVYIPKYMFPIEKCLSSFVNMLFSLVAVLIMFIVLQFCPPVTVVLIFIPMIYSMIFSIGLGLILATVNVFFRDILHLYSVWTTAWMYLTPIIYSIDALPDVIAKIVKFNPLYYYVEYFRELALYGNIPGLYHNCVCIFFSFSFLLAGLVIFRKYQDKFILYI